MKPEVTQELDKISSLMALRSSLIEKVVEATCAANTHRTAANELRNAMLAEHTAANAHEERAISLRTSLEKLVKQIEDLQQKAFKHAPTK